MSSDVRGRATADDTEPAVVAEGITKQFGDVTAVDDVSFSIDSGSVVGLLGPNGAGKTTLVKSLLGLVAPDAGTVRLGGVDAQQRPREAYAQVDALLEGARNDYWRLTVRENLRYFATVGGVAPDSVATRHDRLLERLDLAGKADEPVRNLSRGMKQKVSLASALAGGASVLFLDEPTLGLDVESARTLQEELRRLVREEGLTVVVSSHAMDVVETVCDRVLVMQAGSIVADDTVTALLRGDDAHVLTLASDGVEPALLADLRAEFPVTEVSTETGGTEFTVRADTETLYALMARLEAAGVTLTRIESSDRRLEDVFVELTGGPAAEGR